MSQGLVAAMPFAACAQALAPLPPQPAGLADPGAGWARGNLPPGPKAAIEALIAEAMGKSVRDVISETRALLIIYRGERVAEAYGRHFAPQTRQLSWSMAKSDTQALAGAAITSGADIDLDAPMPKLYAPASP